MNQLVQKNYLKSFLVLIHPRFLQQLQISNLWMIFIDLKKLVDFIQGHHRMVNYLPFRYCLKIDFLLDLIQLMKLCQLPWKNSALKVLNHMNYLMILQIVGHLTSFLQCFPQCLPWRSSLKRQIHPNVVEELLSMMPGHSLFELIEGYYSRLDFHTARCFQLKTYRAFLDEVD